MRFLFVLFLSVLVGACTRSGAPTAEANRLRVLCYNIHHANPPSRAGVIDIAAIAAVINAQKPDVVMVQEVDVRTGRSGKALDQAAELGRQTGLNAYFFKGIDYDGGEYGIAILSKYPLTNQRRIPLPLDSATRGEPRVLGLATVTLPGKRTVTLANTHLDAQRAPTNRQLQAARIVEVLRQEKHPVILAGDFNDSPDSQTLQLLKRVVEPSCQSCPPTIPVENPNRAIDFVTFTPKDRFRVIEHRVIPERVASDHLPVLVELAY
ncbi:endonuclease [Rudanella paleaurantiibacter]|uniref:Endonuclease n=1 Tax=Rudanella paleaurantiibacter TaxID=2614655 RepID=A0A7J5U1Y7_9BACT|nr:endonuclease/exonuclease/phosphatase family protein [Rudanella paleaurantiibacter]KAB7731787.1 endonuclease [Rudanella paleaurantiibacter]